jgi:hypothetical protein
MMDTTADDIVEQRVDNPLVSYAQFLHEIETSAPYAGKIIASVNLRTVLGGFCRFHGTEAQQKAIARYKALFERAQLGGSKAIDPSLEAVDGGAQNPEAIFEIGADARKALSEADAMFDRINLKRLRFVVVGENGPTAYARHFLGAFDGRAIGRAQVEVRGYADRLAVLWGFQTRP